MFFYCLIEVFAGHMEEIADRVLKLNGAISVSIVMGKWDIVALFKAETPEDFDRVILHGLHEWDEITRTHSLLVIGAPKEPDAE